MTKPAILTVDGDPEVRQAIAHDLRKEYGDHAFLERVFQKLLLTFTWWVNRKDMEGRNVFQGGFLGLDNIGVFDRSAELPTGGYIEQSDGTSWMGMYCLNMLAIALELATENSSYEDIASKFFEHFLYIADAMNHVGGDRDTQLWDEADRFYYDVLHLPNGDRQTNGAGAGAIFHLNLGIQGIPEFGSRIAI